MLENLLRQLLIGISSGMVLFLIAAGASIVISGMGIINFSQAAFFVLGAFLCFTLTKLLNFWWSLLLAPIIVAIVGGVVEFFFLRPLYGKSLLYQLLLTLGVAFIITDAIKTIWGYSIRIVSVPESLTLTVNIFGAHFPMYYIFLIIISAVTALGLWLMFKKTKLGMLFRAIISDREMVANLGINVPLLVTIMFMFGVWLSGIAGVLMAPIIGINAGISMPILLSIITVLVIGGMNSMRGALLAALIMGVANSLGSMLLPWFYTLIPVTLMILVLLIKPEGLLGTKT